MALNRSIMPGAAQLGTMVALGISLGALMMIFPYASALGRLGCFGHWNPGQGNASQRLPWWSGGAAATWGTVLLMLFIVTVLGWFGFPRLDS